MTDCLVFNHYSLPFDNRDTAEKAIPDFLKTCIGAKNAGLKTILIDQTIDSSWFRLELSPGYFWQNWHEQHQTGTNLDAIRAFRSIATQSPFFSTNDIADGAYLFDVSYDGNSDYATISAAAWHESPMTSFATRSPWNTSPIQICISRMDSETAVIVNENRDIHNFYNYSIFLDYLPTLLEKRNASLSSGREIVNKLHDFYPGIFLCGKAAQQLNNWSCSLSILDQVKLSMEKLSQFVSEWEKGNFLYYRSESLREIGLPFQVSGESERVNNCPRLREEREFWLPCGHREFFEQHIKMSSGYRLHFYPDSENKKIYIGYIGPHLKL